MNRLIPLALGLGVAGGAREYFARKHEADLHGEVALVTGGSRGLGLAMARELTKEGCKLAICARDAEELGRARLDLEAHGAEVMTIVCDVGVQSEVDKMVADVLARFGRIDLLATVAGIVEIGQLENLEIDDFRNAMDAMFWGTLYPILAVVPGMRARKHGRIATITSIGGKVSVPHMLSYSAAKFAAVGLSEGLATELAQDGIQVTTIVPGLMNTGSHLHAEFKGTPDEQQGEYTWFALGASMPLNPRADRAAKVFVRAIKRGETERIFPIPYAWLSTLHGVAPVTTTRLLRVMSKVMPNDASGVSDTKPGMAVKERADSKLLNLATAFGQRAANAFNETPHSGASASA
jgi:NAD(P)-dependent dehydrogenase (short-subunit alcohol dehydrogenase family)